jgi:O-antigen/teichoic acid export membrane protein
LYGGGLSVLCAVGLNIFAKQIIIVLFGNRYMESVVYILPISLWIIPVSFLLIVANYSLAVNNTKLLPYALIIACLISFVLIYLSHSNNSQIVYILAVITFVILLITLAQIRVEKREVKYELSK